MHFHFIGSRETYYLPSTIFPDTLLCLYKWLCLVRVILSIPAGRAELPGWSWTNCGCKLHYHHRMGQAQRNMLTYYFQTLDAPLAVVLYQEAGSASAPSCHHVSHGEPVGKVTNLSVTYIIQRGWFGCLFPLRATFICSYLHKAVQQLQLCQQRMY